MALSDSIAYGIWLANEYKKEEEEEKEKMLKEPVKLAFGFYRVIKHSDNS